MTWIRVIFATSILSSESQIVRDCQSGFGCRMLPNLFFLALVVADAVKEVREE